jgi:hypothetical protein
MRAHLELANASIREGIFPATLKYQQLNQFMKKGQKKMQTIIIQLLLSQLFQRFWKSDSKLAISFRDKHNIFNKSVSDLGK